MFFFLFSLLLSHTNYFSTGFVWLNCNNHMPLPSSEGCGPCICSLMAVWGSRKPKLGPRNGRLFRCVATKSGELLLVLSGIPAHSLPLSISPKLIYLLNSISFSVEYSMKLNNFIVISLMISKVFEKVPKLQPRLMPSLSRTQFGPRLGLHFFPSPSHPKPSLSRGMWAELSRNITRCFTTVHKQSVLTNPIPGWAVIVSEMRNKACTVITKGTTETASQCQTKFFKRMFFTLFNSQGELLLKILFWSVDFPPTRSFIDLERGILSTCFFDF